MSRWDLNISTEGESTTSLDNLSQCSVTPTLKKFFRMSVWNFLCSELHCIRQCLWEYKWEQPRPVNPQKHKMCSGDFYGSYCILCWCQRQPVQDPGMLSVYWLGAPRGSGLLSWSELRAFQKPNQALAILRLWIFAYFYGRNNHFTSAPHLYFQILIFSKVVNNSICK